MNTKNSEVFLATFNKLEKHFKNKFFRGSWKSFKQMLKEGSRNNPVIWQFKEELFEFTDLRNAIVHNRSHNYQVIAEPHTFIVERFEFITQQIMNPTKVSKFNKTIHSCLTTDPIHKALNIIKKYQISQVPILNNNLEITETLNTSTITYWLGQNKFNPDSTILEVLKHKEHPHNFKIVKANTSIYNASELFKQSYKNEPHNKYFDALLITQNGRADEKLKGIIVLSDIAEYL